MWSPRNACRKTLNNKPYLVKKVNYREVTLVLGEIIEKRKKRRKGSFERMTVQSLGFVQKRGALCALSTASISERSRKTRGGGHHRVPLLRDVKVWKVKRWGWLKNFNGSGSDNPYPSAVKNIRVSSKTHEAPPKLIEK